MSARNCLIILLIALGTNLCKAQEKVPLVKGNVTISITKGTFACDLFLSNLPYDVNKLKNYVIRLNSGMNVRYFKDVKYGTTLDYDNDPKDTIMSDEVQSYIPHEHPHGRDPYLPDELEVKYLGMYNVVPDSASGYMGDDWRGNIAFNGYSVRAEGLQGCWAPTLYDKVKRKLYSEVRYDITVTCSDCSVLFVNGSAPQRGTKARFVSDVPYELAIYCGKFEAVESKGIWLLNPGMTKDDEQKLFGIANSYEAYYSKQFGIPFKGNHTFVQTDPVADPKKWAFAFYSAPTTFNVGVGEYGLASLFDKNNAARNKKTMAHELAHYYFGTLLKTDVEFSHVIEEGFAEYLALTLTRDVEGPESYHDVLRDRMLPLRYLHNYKPFAKALTEDDYGNREYYLYYYTPVILTAIEKEIGKAAMWKWLRTMVSTMPEHVDYNFMLNAFKTAVPDKALQEKITSKYFDSGESLANAEAEIGKI